MEDAERRIHDILARSRGAGGDPAAQDALWEELVRGVLAEADVPFEMVWDLWRRVFEGRPASAAPPAAWRPSKEVVDRSNIAALMRLTGHGTYEALHRWSATDRAGFWSAAVERLGIPFRTPPHAVMDRQADVRRPGWFAGATLNAAEACFRGGADRPAILWGREGSDAVERISYGQLDRLTCRVAHGLRSLGLRPGEAVALYMPMTPECVAAYLGIVRAGLVVVSIPDSFAPPEVAARLRIGRARLLVTVDTFARAGRRVELYAKAVKAKAPRTVVIPEDATTAPSLRQGDLLWDAFLGPEEAFEAVACPPEAVTNILFSSGTTGEPKGIPWTHLTPIKAAVDGHFHHDIHPDDVVAWPTNIGWMMGPWLIYASLANRATMALYGGVPTARGFLEFVRAAGVTMLGLVPAIVRKWREDGTADGLRLGTVRVFSSTGEASNAFDTLWLMGLASYRAPVIEYCGGTEIGGGHITGTVVQPASPATFTTPALGLDFVVLDAQGQPVGEGASGELFVVPPSVGLSERLINKDHDEVYYADVPAGGEGRVLRRHGDEILRLPGGYWQALGRADDTMNLGGIKVASVELERVLNAHPDVYETAAVAVPPPGGGADRLVVYAVLAREDVDPGALRAGLQARIKEDLNPLFRIHDVVAVPTLPRTASNKVMRRELRKTYRESPAAVP